MVIRGALIEDPAKFCEERIHDVRSLRSLRRFTGRRSAMARRARYRGFALQNFGQGADGDARRPPPYPPGRSRGCSRPSPPRLNRLP